MIAGNLNYSFCAQGLMNLPLKVLILESSRFFRNIEKQFLAKTPVEVIEAEDAASALTICREQKPSLVYVAAEIGDESGIEFCRKIKGDALLRTIPVVLICDANNASEVDACRKSGAEGVLTKPIDRHKFLEIGRHHLPTIREPRRTCLFPLSFAIDGKDYTGKCLDISTGGIFVDTPEKPSIGKVINLSFSLPGLSDGAVTCKGVVAWHNERPNPMKPNYPLGFGVSFVDLPLTQKQSIEQFSRR